MQKAYLIPVAAAAALGYTAGEWDIYEVNAKEISYSETISAELAGPSQAALAGVLNAELCDAIEADMGLTAGVCSAQKVFDHSSGVSIQREVQDDASVKYFIRTHIRLPGQVVVSVPE